MIRPSEEQRDENFDRILDALGADAKQGLLQSDDLILLADACLDLGAVLLIKDAEDTLELQRAWSVLYVGLGYAHTSRALADEEGDDAPAE